MHQVVSSLPRIAIYHRFNVNGHQRKVQLIFYFYWFLFDNAIYIICYNLLNMLDSHHADFAAGCQCRLGYVACELTNTILLRFFALLIRGDSIHRLRYVRYNRLLYTLNKR